ncbi:flagellar hook-length control protein FliK [Novosphingobium profundi]|uniref:flagellar hook-length control protein FliK n=1 Tax=Novosphingobium profundi TaxID=1774954 RepID=UPI001BDB0F64|nr:flagellar hook-length control protein FliK [Novosphingobium profundi]MBT0670525.1 flagellar hook-length control protein FliK [Novosphingobium profundi]
MTTSMSVVALVPTVSTGKAAGASTTASGSQGAATTNTAGEIADGFAGLVGAQGKSDAATGASENAQGSAQAGAPAQILAADTKALAALEQAAVRAGPAADAEPTDATPAPPEDGTSALPVSPELSDEALATNLAQDGVSPVPFEGQAATGDEARAVPAGEDLAEVSEAVVSEAKIPAGNSAQPNVSAQDAATMQVAVTAVPGGKVKSPAGEGDATTKADDGDDTSAAGGLQQLASLPGDVPLAAPDTMPSAVPVPAMVAVAVQDVGQSGALDGAGEATTSGNGAASSRASRAEAKVLSADTGATGKLAVADQDLHTVQATTHEGTSSADEGKPFERSLASIGTGSTSANTVAEAGAPRADANAPTGAWLSQTMAPIGTRPSALPYAANAQSSTTSSADVQVREGQFGTDMGVEIARALGAGSDDLLIKLDPRHLGRIDVRLSFDHAGVLRATMSADSTGAADMLRRESGDLVRSLADAGIRADGQSLRFDTRAGGQSGQGAGQGWSGSQGSSDQRGSGGQGQSQGRFAGRDEPVYRSLGASGHVDLIA